MRKFKEPSLIYPVLNYLTLLNRDSNFTIFVRIPNYVSQNYYPVKTKTIRG